ncbi:unnamed protein product [Urochloa decumbens]|uniref:Carbohydrate kinase PfkB domain-containing protein n=1 Tax=Urochloa decumbens TaxID=240449 RepID=A0ABC9BLE2_9POAL
MLFGLATVALLRAPPLDASVPPQPCAGRAFVSLLPSMRLRARLCAHCSALDGSCCPLVLSTFFLNTAPVVVHPSPWRDWRPPPIPTAPIQSWYAPLPIGFFSPFLDTVACLQLGCGASSVDYLATVASFPNPDKIRSLALKVQGGGNTGNALTAAARLGLHPRIISKVANDAQGRNVLKELQDDGIDTSYMLVAEDGNTPFTYIIVDNQTKTRTCIHTPGYPPMSPEELTKESLSAALAGADIVYFDVRLHDTALVVAQECRQFKEKSLS